MTCSSVILFSFYGMDIYLFFLVIGFFFLSQGILFQGISAAFSFDFEADDINLNAVENIESSDSINTTNVNDENLIGEGIDFEIEDIVGNYGKYPKGIREQRTPYPRLFSFRILKLSFFIFGLVGFVLEYFITSALTCFVIALVFSILSCLIYYFVLRLIVTQTIYNIVDPVFEGREAVVVLPIPINGFGKVIVWIVGKRHEFRASSMNNTEIKQGTMIRILKKTRSTCVVIPIL